MSLLCHIRYEFDPFQREAFATYAGRWATIIPDCGATCLGYFMPAEGTNDVAYGLNLFDDLAHYERYRQRLREDAAGAANFRFAEDNRLILRERRTFLRPAPGHGAA